MPEIKLDFEPEHFERVQAAAASVGMDPKAFLLMLLARVVKPISKPLRPVGRPPESAQSKRLKELASVLREIYERLRSGPWHDDQEKFRTYFGPQISDFERLVAEKNLEALEDFFLKRPWTVV